MTPPRIAAILAGGGSLRMGADKATIALGGMRMIDRVIARLGDQVERIVISGPSSFATGLEAVADVEGAGPVAGVAAVHGWLTANIPKVEGFLCVPVDGPFCPRDLYARLGAVEFSTYAATSAGPQPTFAYWRTGDLDQALPRNPRSLLALAEACRAQPVAVSPDDLCLNVNTTADIARALALLCCEQGY